MAEKIAVVTGTSSGFGLLTSVELARKGFTVIATMRDTNKSFDLLKAAKNHGVESKIIVHELDVTNEQSINRLKSVCLDLGSIHVLVNNAGYAGAGFVEEISLEEFRKQFETNVFGVIAVTKSILPLMRRQGYGTIINLSSISGRMAFPGLSPYTASKHAIEGWSESLRLEMKPFGVNVVLIEPGSYKTNIWTTGKHVAVKSFHAESAYKDYMEKIENYITKGVEQFSHPLEVAQLIAKVAEEREPKLRYLIGRGVKFSLLIRILLPWRLWENIVIKKIFGI